MSDNARCCYCSRLPERRPGHGSRVQRCPLCKSEVGLTASGDAFRIATGPAPSHHRLVGAVAVCGLIGVSMAVTAWNFVFSARPALPIAATSPGVTDVPEPIVVAESSTRSHGESKSFGAAAETVGAVKPAIVRSAAKRNGSVFDTAAGSLSRVKAPALSPLARGHAKPDGSVFAVSAAWYAGVKSMRRPPWTLAKHEGALPPIGPDWLAPSVRTPESATLASVPEVRFESSTTKNELLRSFEKVVEKHKKGSEAFLAAAVQDRPELGGLPYLKGAACKLTQTQSEALGKTSGMVRALLESVGERDKRRIPSQSMSSNLGSTGDEDAVVFNCVCERYSQGALSMPRTRAPAEYLPALTQILAAERPAYRTSIVRQLEQVPPGDDAAIAALVRMALYDPEASVRGAAVKALKREPFDRYGSKLVESFRHPSRHVAEHAADAIVALELFELLPKLVDFLAEPDPAAPFEVEQAGKKVLAIREVVKLNHHRNCLLCHAPATIDGTERNVLRSGLIARVPSPDEELPPSNSRVYYSLGRGEAALVRADETYLRQDFTVMQAVENSGKWPKMQRFDFLVRTRNLSADEIKQRALAPSQAAADDVPSPHHRAAAVRPEPADVDVSGVEAGGLAARSRSACPRGAHGRTLSSAVERASQLALFVRSAVRSTEKASKLGSSLHGKRGSSLPRKRRIGDNVEPVVTDRSRIES